MKLPNCESCGKKLAQKGRVMIVLPRSELFKTFGFCMSCAEKMDVVDMTAGGLFAKNKKETPLP